MICLAHYEPLRVNKLALVDLLSAGFAGALWYLFPELGPWPLVIGLVPWAGRLLLREGLGKGTPFNLPLLVFLLAGLIGVWVAYDPASANEKFWLIAGALLIFFAVARQPAGMLWFLGTFFGLIAVTVAVYFLLSHDWQAIPAKFAPLQSLALRWSALRPPLPTHQLHPNVAGGLIAMFFPFLVPATFWARRHAGTAGLVLALAGAALAAVGLLLTTSRGAWLALFAALASWGLVVLLRCWLPRRLVNAGLLLLLVVAGVVVAGAVWMVPQQVAGLVNQLPGPANAASRVELLESGLDLFGDFPLTGGGLAAFPALYSAYIMVTPFYLLPHAHNLLLDVAVEQGILGLAALVAILAGTVHLLWKQSDRQWALLRQATLAGLLVLLLHGLIEDALYGSRALLFLFLLPGLAVSLARADGEEPQPIVASRPVLITFALTLVVLLLGQWSPAVWPANWGALLLSREQLAEWPTGAWDDGSEVDRLQPALPPLQRALALDGANRTAHHRLGLIALLERDFVAARDHLEAAHAADPAHRGIRKTLGYTYVWNGEIEKAVITLAGISEARQEMNTYIWWWGEQGRDDLAQQAANAAERLPPDQDGANQ